MSEETKPAEPKPAAKMKRPSADAIMKALGKSAEFASIDGNVVVIVYPDLAVYSDSVSRDVEAIRAISPNDIASEVSPHDPERERLSRVANAPPIPAYQPKPDGAQRLVVTIL